MTHYTVGIIVPHHQLSNIDAFVIGQMDPYCESLEVEPYVCYSLAQAKDDLADDIARLEGILQRQDANFQLKTCEQRLRELRATTPEARYGEYIRSHERFDKEGYPLSTYNPNSKWDWYVIGGRWDGWINDREASGETVLDNLATTEQALKRRKSVHALVTPDGRWHEHGQMGWWGLMLTENPGWERRQRTILRQFPRHHLLILDAHI